MRADDLAALPLKALMERNANADWAALDGVILGCANQAVEDIRLCKLQPFLPRAGD